MCELTRKNENPFIEEIKRKPSTTFLPPPPTMERGPNLKTRCSRAIDNCLFSAPPVPLVTLTQTYFPKTTDALLRLTYRYLPGASPPPPLATRPTKTRVDNVHHTEIVLARTNEFTTSLNLPLSTNVVVMDEPPPGEPEERTFKASKYRMPIQVCLITVFAALTLICLAWNGYMAQNSEGKFPLSVSAASTFWQGKALSARAALACGEDAVECRPFATAYWLGLHCSPDATRRTALEESLLVVRGADVYTADSQICASAVHAGVIQPDEGGCFEARLVGARNEYAGNVSRHGITSQAFGWFPRSIEYRAVENGGRNCHDISWSADLVISLAFVVFYLVWRIDGEYANWVLVQFGFAYAGLKQMRRNGQFLVVANQLLARQFTLIPACYMLFHVFTPGFCPNPTRFPLEATMFAAVYFTFIHLHDFEHAFHLDNFTFTMDLFQRASMAYIAFFAVLITVVALGAAWQLTILYRAGLTKIYLIGLVCCIAVLVILALPAAPVLSFHFHHFFFGLCLCALARGQRAFSMLVQAIGLALFVEGVAVYNIAPLFDVRANGASAIGYQIPLADNASLPIPLRDNVEPVFEPIVWTSALFLNDTTIELEWALPSELAITWECDEEVGHLVPEIWRAMSDLNDLNWTPPAPKAERLFYVLENGILQNSERPRNARKFTKHAVDIQAFEKQPLVYDVVLVDDWIPSLVKLPMPFPLNRTEPYHAVNATLCERLFGIYSRVQGLRFNHTELVWWQ